MEQATQTLSQIKTGAKPSDAFFIFTTIRKGAKSSDYLPSEDSQGEASKGKGENAWNIDHNLELQMLAFAFTSANQKPYDNCDLPLLE